MIATGERILTDNEKWGNGHLIEDAPGGVWIVLYHADQPDAHISFVAGNRGAAQDYIWEHCYSEEHPNREAGEYSIQVWHISDHWPDEEE